MKKLILLLSVVCTFGACETDFEVISEWQDIPVIYGLLDQSAPTNYVRVSRAFLGDIDARDAAQVADSLYYPADMEVKLKGFRFTNDVNANNFNYQDEINYTINDVLERVNLNDEGLEKEEGIFAQDPSIAYKYSKQLEEDFGYVLEFTTPSGKLVRAFTPIVEELRITRPDVDDEFDLEIQSNKQNWQVRWNQLDYAELFNISFEFTFTEAPTIDVTDETFKTIFWNPSIGSSNEIQSVGTAFYEENISKEGFYNYLSSKLERSSDIVRVVKSLNVVINASTGEFKNYISANAAQTGISTGQVKPEFSNVEGGLGIFTSKVESTAKISRFNLAGLEAFACDTEILNGLNFVWNANDPLAPCP